MTDQQVDQVCQLSQWLAGTDITLLELSSPDKCIRLRRNGNGAVSEPVRQSRPSKEASAPAPTVVRAGSVGVVLHSHPLRTEPLVRPGQEVAAGQTVALLKIGLVLLPVPAPRAGTIRRIAAAHEATVGFGDALVELESQGNPWTSI